MAPATGRTVPDVSIRRLGAPGWDGPAPGAACWQYVPHPRRAPAVGGAVVLAGPPCWHFSWQPGELPHPANAQVPSTAA